MDMGASQPNRPSEFIGMPPEIYRVWSFTNRSTPRNRSPRPHDSSFDTIWVGWHVWDVRIMGLDVGSRTIGVALSDETAVLASPLVTLRREGLEADLDRLLEIIKRNDVGEVVVGLPLNMNGALGHRARRVMVLVEALRNRWTGRVETWDERLSTKAAQRALLEADMSRKRRKQVVDKVAASVILQGYLLLDENR